jgi:hypothetical protein
MIHDSQQGKIILWAFTVTFVLQQQEMTKLSAEIAKPPGAIGTIFRMDKSASLPSGKTAARHESGCRDP